MSGTATTPPSPTAAWIDATGIHTQSYQTILTYLTGKYQTIYGNDVYVGNDAQDAQMIGVFALALSDANSMAVASYNSFSPTTAQGVGLSSNVKINGIQRLIPTNSTADLLLVGQVGKPVTNGIVSDENSNQWALPSSITFPISGQITVTATCTTPGAINAAAGTINQIENIQQGWQSAVNIEAANPGQPVEQDPALKARQAQSTMIPSQTVLDGITGAVEAVLNVTRVKGYQNATSSVDANGAPPNSLYMVVEGGDVNQIASVIAVKKTLGAPTYGTTTITVPDNRGGTDQISFFVRTDASISGVINITPLAGYVDADGASAIASLVAFINALPIGATIVLTELYGPAYDTGIATYKISSIQICRTGNALGSVDIQLAFNEAATADNTTFTVNVAGP
jgi:uncharacterized phage protein gp47/JayE